LLTAKNCYHPLVIVIGMSSGSRGSIVNCSSTNTLGKKTHTRKDIERYKTDYAA